MTSLWAKWRVMSRLPAAASFGALFMLTGGVLALRFRKSVGTHRRAPRDISDAPRHRDVLRSDAMCAICYTSERFYTRFLLDRFEASEIPEVC